MQKKQNTGLVWFRNNLRVKDNYILQEALLNHSNIVACYCFDPQHYEFSEYGFKKTEKYRAKFLIETVTELKLNLKKLDVELFVYHDKPEKAIPKLIEECNITQVYLQKEWTYEENSVFQKVISKMAKEVSFTELYDQFLFHPQDLAITLTEIPRVFTNFRKYVENNSKVRKTVKITTSIKPKPFKNTTKIPNLENLGLEDFKTHPNSAFPFKGGETQALERLHYYFFETKKLGYYKKTRNGLIGTDFSSKFSPWLANGSISVRTIFWKVKQFEQEHFKNQSTYWLVFELIWRDYFKYISLKHGNNIFKLNGINGKNYNWEQDSNKLNSWIKGETHSSFVNANMIELRKTGWMSNRGRQNVASYLSKDLKLDWRMGASYFESLLIDYDVHSNYGNWMYVAGVGNDPRDRKFNVDLQAERYDSSGKFQILWLQTALFE